MISILGFVTSSYHHHTGEQKVLIWQDFDEDTHESLSQADFTFLSLAYYSLASMSFIKHSQTLSISQELTVIVVVDYDEIVPNHPRQSW